MKYNNQTLMAFLRAKGWIDLGKNQRFYVFTPPKDFPYTFDDPNFFIPIHTDNPTYNRQMQPLVATIADLYDIQLQDFTDVISTSPERIKKTGKLISEIMAFV